MIANTEKAFVDALKVLHGKLTIIIVAHRLTTVQNCDRIVEIGK
jgi:ABC-type multidrug transport system fused ATPase/permease subunit